VRGTNWREFRILKGEFHMEVGESGINNLPNPELIELAKALEEKFQHTDRVFVFNLPDHLKDLFKDTFGTYVEKSTFKAWVQEVFPHEDSGEKIFPAIAEAGIAKEGRKSFPQPEGKRGKEAGTRGKKGKEFYELAIRAITKVATLKKSYDALAVVALYLHPKLTHDELLNKTLEINDILGEKYSASSIRKAVSNVVNNRSLVRKIEGRSTTWFELHDDLMMDISKVLNELILEAKAKEELAAEEAENIEGMAAKFFRFFTTYGVDTGKAFYVEKLREVLAERGGRSLAVDYVHVNAFIPDVAAKLLERPDDVIQAAEMAIREVLKEPPFDYSEEDLPEVHVRFFNLPQSVAPRRIGSDHLNRFIQVEGVVSRITEVKPFVHKAVYVCRACGNEMVRLQNPYSVYMKRPEKCEACGSRDLYLDDEKSTFIDYQTIRVQDAPEVLRGGQMPRFLDVVLLDDLVDSVQPGDRVIITGVLRRVEEKTEKRPVVRKVLIANHVQPVNRDLDEIELTREDEQRIREEAGKPYFKERLVRSIAPNIYGMDRIKEGIALSLVGGIGERPDGTKMRDAIHVLLVGDPGKGKSAVLEFLRKVAPRSILASAEGVTKAGFTAAAVRDELTGEWVLEAGVMVLADKGFALLDEFEKMKESDRNAIHRAMEQGTVEIHKAGINATLNARATVIAAANPVHGRWNFNEDIADQLKLPPTIISRFDLIFPVIDEPDPKEDKKLAESMLGLGREESSPAAEPYDEEFLKKFIAYARRNVHPRLSREAAVLLGEYYVELRRRAKREGGFFKIPITARQLEALIRLTTAHARLHLRETATVEDARAAIDLLEYSLRQLLPPDQREELDVNVIMVGKHTRELVIEEEVINAIRALDDGEGAPETGIISLLKEKGITEEKVRAVIEDLKERGEITAIRRVDDIEFYRWTPR